MNDQEKPVTDAELHAYLDGEVEEADRLRIEAYLAEHPHLAGRLGRYQDINTGLHRLFDPVLNEAQPDVFREYRNPRGSAGLSSPLLRAAALAAIAVLAGLSGWTLRDYLQQSVQAPELAHLVHPAAYAHVVYSTDPRYPVEFSAEQKDALADWLSERMHTDIRAPLLNDTGFDLVGGRLLPSTNRMAAQFMYQDAAGERITLYVRRNAWDGEATLFRFGEHDGVTVFYWTDGPMAYAVAGEISKKRLITVAQAAQASFGGN
jgi:anti-sigma factor RsiW